MSLGQARHNEKLCLFLDDNSEYPDWVVTTSYYSAIHYVYQLFPLKIIIGGKTKSFENFYRYYSHIRRDKQISKHDATIQLAEEHYPEFASELKV